MEQGHSCGGCGSGCNTHEQHSCDCNKTKKKTMTIQIDGVDIPCYVLCVFQDGDQSYIALQNKDNDRIYMYRYQEEDDQILLEDITEQEELRSAGRLLIAFLDRSDEHTESGML